MVRPLLLVMALGVGTLGCATAKLAGGAVPVPTDPGVARTVVIEPFFEQSEWTVVTKTERATVYSGGASPYGYGGPQDVTITRQVAEKPVFARIPMLAAEQQQLISEVQRLRPSWRVTSTGGLPATTGALTVVRTVVGEAETVESDRAFKNLACAFGVLLPPLLLFTISPVHETQRVTGAVVRFEADAETLRPRLLKYPTQPDFAVDTRGLTPLSRQYGLDIAYEEGLLASEAPREPVLVEGFVQKLAAAVIAIVEEPR